MFEGKRISFIGAGNMAEAIIRGILRADLVEPRQVIATGPRAERRGQLHHRYGIQTVAENVEACEADIVVLGVKPQIMPELLHEIAEAISDEHVVISLAAGINIDAIQTGLGAKRAVVRTMPNLPVNLFEGVTVLSHSPSVTTEDRRLATALFESVGTTYELDESLLDAITAFTGSGPAFVFAFTEAFANAARDLGVPEALVEPMATQTLLGSAKLLAESESTAAELRAKVCSPGGTALAGLSSWNENGFVDIVARALKASTERAATLGEAASRVLTDRS